MIIIPEYFEKLINSQFEGIRKDHSDIKHQLEQILIQTTITNGRVRELETWRASAQGHWKGVILMSTIIGFVVGIIAVYLWH